MFLIAKIYSKAHDTMTAVTESYPGTLSLNQVT